VLVEKPVVKAAPAKRGHPKAVSPPVDTGIVRPQRLSPSRAIGMTPWGLIDIGRPRKRLAILDTLEQVDLVLSHFISRYESVPAELRAEIMTGAYEPLLMILIQAGRRGQKAKPHRWSSRKEAAIR
jgi:hypothetical protein